MGLEPKALSLPGTSLYYRVNAGPFFLVDSVGLRREWSLFGSPQGSGRIIPVIAVAPSGSDFKEYSKQCSISWVNPDMYRSIVAVQRGGPEVLRVVENELPQPSGCQARVRVQATTVGATDVNYRYGRSLFSPKVPFVPGYEIVGVVDAVGPQVSEVAVGDRVAALIGHGGYTEVICLDQQHLAPVPESVTAGDAAVVTLNYVAAYQLLHRVAEVSVGDKVLVIGASGGVGTALLDLGKLAGLSMVGLASVGKLDAVSRLGAVALDYQLPELAKSLRVAAPGGFDFVFDGVGGDSSDLGLSVLKPGAMMVSFAAPQGLSKLLVGLAKLLFANVATGKKVRTYGISELYHRDRQPFMEDIALLFKLLVDSRIKPVIFSSVSLLEAAHANAALEAGEVVGATVLVAAPAR